MKTNVTLLKLVWRVESRESYRLGYLSKQRATQLVRVDVEKTGSVYDFCVSCGWVAAQN